MTDAERIARLEAELEQLRKSFAQERSQLENQVAAMSWANADELSAARSDREDLNAALEDVAKLRVMLAEAEARPKWRDAPRVLNPVPPNTTVEHRLDDRGAVPGSTGPRIDRSKCPDCGVTRLTSDDGCSWCGPGAHR